MSDELNPSTVLNENAQRARARAITLDERAERIERDPEMSFASVLLRRGAMAERERADWLKAEAERLALEST